MKLTIQVPGGTMEIEADNQQDIIKQAKLAGFSENDMIIMDNQYDAVIGLKNADIMLSRNPDFFMIKRPNSFVLW
jgi:hypothetical protein